MEYETNITTKQINEIISRFSREDQEDIKSAMRINGLTLWYFKGYYPQVNYLTREVRIKDGNGAIVGQFKCYGHTIGDIKEFFDTGNTISMEIFLEDYLQGNKLSKLMIAALCIKFIEEYPHIRKEQFFFIDGDGSGGFWKRIGMEEGRYGYTGRFSLRPIEGKGQEKSITFGDLTNWALGIRMGEGGKKRKMTKRKMMKKRKTTRKRKTMRKRKTIRR